MLPRYKMTLNFDGKKHLVLDMDETLICMVENRDEFFPKPYARPNLREFLKIAFDEFETVSIFTAASEIWYNHVYENVLKDYIPQGNSFHKVFKRNDCIRDENGNYHKPLHRMHDDPTEVLLIDDNPTIFEMNPVGSCFLAERFEYDKLDSDKELYILGVMMEIRNRSSCSDLK